MDVKFIVLKASGYIFDPQTPTRRVYLLGQRSDKHGPAEFLAIEQTQGSAPEDVTWRMGTYVLTHKKVSIEWDDGSNSEYNADFFAMCITDSAVSAVFAENH